MSSISQKRKEGQERRHRRIRVKLSGTPERPRLAVRRTDKHIYAQLVDDESGRSLGMTSSLDPSIKGEMSGKTKSERCQLVGKRIAEIAKEKGIVKVAFDRGGHIYHGRVKALAESAREGGLEF
ncbi:MAG: 50S ribosomal protein L18 [Candidatus Eisenbacteria bacterium]|uniref:Large ribosomal subunit protein uL18 n=1 Tax=Eiseniibacteriota bacterium TaxID=2212470 RepID=A0A956NEK4_UNCEI|nr:50S ribosomal protein L18 [Candidatus Eisenbacteria bacterium]MCB9463614.1 50S ribosomal protein L18 [Candidatus Eisenbacteria bacterium]